MKIVFEKMDINYQKEVMEIFNYYVVNSTAAFPTKELPEHFYAMLLKKSEGYPAYVMIDQEKNKVAGFCQLSAYNPFASFSKTACVTYFIASEYTSKGLGSMCLSKLEEEAKEMEIEHLIAEISSENSGSISFHKKHGFETAGELHNIGEKFDRKFGIVLMSKVLAASKNK